MSGEPVLTSSWCTNWAGFNTPRLWAMVSDEDDPDAWRQVAAWADVAVTVKDQRARLVQARDSLSAAWPPEQNGSAQAFVTQLDTLIVRMDAAQQDADTTASGLANILEALRTAKNQIEPLYEEYKQKSDDWVPSWWDNAEDEIDQKAQAVMISAEQIVEQNVPQLKVPDAYVMDPKGGRIDFTSPDHSDPSISGRAAGPGAAASIPVPHDPVPPMPGQNAIVPADAGPSAPDASFVGQTGPASVGPGLAGVITPPPTGVPPAGTIPPGTPGVLPPGGGGPVPGIPPIAPPLSGILPGAGVGGGVVPGVGGGVARGVRPVSGVAGRALPSGAVIGETVGGVRGGGFVGAPEVGGVAGRGVVGGGVSGGVAGRGAGVGEAGRGGIPGRTLGEVGPGGVAGRGGVAGGRGGAARGVGGAEIGRGGVAGRGVGGAEVGRGGVVGRGVGGAEVGGVSGRGTGRAGARGAKPKPPSWLPEDEPRGSGAGRGAASGGPAGMASGRRASRRDGTAGEHYDPDNPWEVAEGVDPVIAPSDEIPHHDPGPNVIGWRE